MPVSGRKNMFIKSKQRIALKELLKNSFHFSCNYQILTGIITLNDLKTADIKDSELEGINSFVDQVEGIIIGVTIRELPDGNTRCSMRTSGSISANEICHFLAAVDIIMQPPVSLKCQYMRRELLLSKFARVTSENMRVDVQSSKITIMQAIPSVRSIFQFTNSKAPWLCKQYLLRPEATGFLHRLSCCMHKVVLNLQPIIMIPPGIEPGIFTLKG